MDRVNGRTSVVIPCYRDDRFLAAAIDSVCQQTKKAREIIVVDDGSPVPLSKIEPISGQSLVWVRTDNRGLGAARNRGISEASGEFVAFLDADDIWLPEKIQLQEQLLDRCPEAVACYTHCVDEPGFFKFGPYPRGDLPRGLLAHLLWHGQFYPPSSLMVRKHVMDQLKGFREGLANGEDLDLNFRLLKKGEILGCTEPLLKYRVHDGQITRSSVKKILGQKVARQHIIKECADVLREAGIEPGQHWDAYREKVVNVFYRRHFSEARPMLWDYWKDHPRDWRVLLYTIATFAPPRWVSAMRGEIS
ncbi:glycosyltransferase family 2 protein [Roseiconus lacunae]|uniref:glycosyltransferase family 2 protein n=1 Tax=Roseiconus lacunae TaxID=2605694 RepID=UPI0011F1DED0|nr:glycosyltransferase family A protein [Roseiconus lacunae]